jgi:Spy/CpxP family protein refolding chaperone
MHARLILIVCVLSAFGAGVCSALVWKNVAQKPHDPFLGELNLTDEQREKIKGFWSEAMKENNWQAQRELREAAQKERETAIRALLSEEQRAGYDLILSDYQGKIDALNQQSRRGRDEAIEKTKAILTEEQRAKYDELRKKRFEGRSKRPDGDGPPGPPPGLSGPPPDFGPPPHGNRPDRPK